MPAWGWVVIAIAAVVLVGVVVWQALARRRRARLQEQFGPEYDRTVETAESRRDAEAELRAREDRRKDLEIRPLSTAARERYVASWQAVQAQFVDDPEAAVAQADRLVQAVMSERGYPVDDFEQRAADVSVDHPDVVENYRRGHSLAQTDASDGDSTENLRQAMRHYRALFDDLLEPGADDPTARERAGAEPAEEQDRGTSRERTVQ